MVVGAPGWATPAWREWAAHIVASEARGVPSADIVVAAVDLYLGENGAAVVGIPWPEEPQVDVMLDVGGRYAIR